MKTARSIILAVCSLVFAVLILATLGNAIRSPGDVIWVAVACWAFGAAIMALWALEEYRQEESSSEKSQEEAELVARFEEDGQPARTWEEMERIRRNVEDLKHGRAE